MSIKIEIKGTEVKVVTGKHGTKEGKQFRIPELHGYAAVTGARHPEPIVIGIPAPKEQGDKTGHYAQGKYRLGAASFYVGSRELRLREHMILLPEDAPASQCVLRVTVHGTKSANRKDGTLVTVLDCDAHIPNENYPIACFIEPRQDTAPGEYFISPDSFEVENRRLIFKAKPVLVSAQSASKAS